MQRWIVRSDSNVKGLRRNRLKMERRSLRLRVRGLEWEWRAPDELVLSFELIRGGYATAVLGWMGQVEVPDRKRYSWENAERTTLPTASQD